MATMKLTPSQFLEVLEDVFGIQKEYADSWIKIEKPLKKETTNVEAIRVYLPELRKNVNQCTERGENPKFLIKRTLREKTRQPEIEIVFMGSTKDRHVEDLSYFKKPPEEWSSWGEIVLTLEQAQKLIEALTKMIA